MLLAVDIGNTHTVFGVYREQTLLQRFRMETRPKSSADEIACFLSTMLAAKDLKPGSISSIAIASVVPDLAWIYSEMCASLFSLQPRFIDHGTDTGLSLARVARLEVGADRIVNAAEAWRRFGASITVDFGTATTFDVVNPAGEYLGGCICPGIGVSMEALHQKASKLPRISVRKPPRCLGSNTVEAMQAGVYFGYVSMVDGLVQRLKAEAAFPLKVLATGGLAELICQDSSEISAVLPDLTLDGIAWIVKRQP